MREGDPLLIGCPCPRSQHNSTANERKCTSSYVMKGMMANITPKSVDDSLWLGCCGLCARQTTEVNINHLQQGEKKLIYFNDLSTVFLCRASNSSTGNKDSYRASFYFNTLLHFTAGCT